ncbi:iron complex outermembrane receptor protein [Arenibacter algicola]|jgi:iron complex outermembrane receptor protein|uniref:Iron complex outermembrane receptor protein n=1 Tax=Arenibacter algicola TaxID=616991 RepID=A0A221UX83_9FLAO|nr:MULTISPECIES: TonB-dependent receptor [Arenibacter]ASO05501.1 TonB-dependent receptor SusC [Arenibacter algicola]GBF21317.1 ferric enterobactin receptor precursor [Arenibacter sp. NBRC 103722]|tara:strand:- start:62771 stop:65719 length:2949 start_codon:yes stop_codon:yes gene_type:complete
MKKLKFLMFVFVIGTSMTSWAQTTVTGTVSDEQNVPLPGATVLEKGTSNGTTTDFDGNFTIQVSDESAILAISFLGYATKEYPLNGQTNVSAVLQEDSSLLDEVVVVGYGTQRIKDVTGAVKRVTSEDFNKGVVNNAGQLIQGKAAGVNVTSSSGEPGSGQRIVIRGQGTIRSGSGPLFVLDGFPLGLAGTGSGESPLNFINPDDIESIDVLKDASATAIYGSRGANGVVIITTKNGKAGVSKISLSTNVGVSTLARKLDVFTADEFRREVAAIPGSELIDGGGSTDWQDELTRAAITQNHNLVLSGGTEKVNYYASLGLQDQEGIVYNSGLKRTSARINVTQKLLQDRLKIDYNLNTTITEQSRNNNLGYSTNPTFDAYTADGEINNPLNWNNPLLSNKYNGDFSESRRILINIAPSFEILDGLVYKLNVGYENRSSDRDQQTIANSDRNDLGFLRQSFGKYENNLIENYLTYTFDVGDHNLSILGGHSYQKTFSRSSSWSIDEFPADTGIDPRNNPGLGGDTNIVDHRPSGSTYEDELQSYFGRANWSFKDRYLFTATVRADGSSKFGGNNKYGVFSSFAGSWRIIEEDFMEGSIFSDLKLRAGWGQTGNQEIPGKITKASFRVSNSSNVSYPIDQNGPYPVGSEYTRFANPDIQWEVSTQSNVGVDFGLFDGSLTGTLDYFHKVSDNILLEVTPVDPIVPAPTYWTNVPGMTITNKGLEVALDYSKQNPDGLSYGFGVNATFIDNLVEDSPFTIVTTGSASGQGLTDATINGFVSGEAIGAFYMQTFTGIGPDGLSQFADNDGDGEITEKDRTIVGSALPDMTYNFYLNLKYRRFDLNANFNGVSGNEIYDHTAMGSFYKTLLSKSNNTTAAAIEYPEESIINSAAVSTRYLKDGSYLRLNNLTFGYSFDTKSMSWASNWLQEFRLSFTGQNLFVITDYDGYDPEVNTDSSTNGIQSFGIDKFAYPKARTFVFGLNVSF